MALQPGIQELILRYFLNGFNYVEIIELLRTRDNYNISLSTLKNWLKAHSIYKRPLIHRRDTVEVVQQGIIDELNGTGSTMGYRRMCGREDVRIILKDIDPNGVELRRRRRLRRRNTKA